MKKEKVLITAALPYANGAIHFGHLAGSYLPADCYARFQRLMGKDVCFICGSDEYGVAIEMSAELAKKTPKEHVDHFHKVNQALFAAMEMSFDHYSRTTWRGHNSTTISFFEALLKNGYIEKRDSERLFCQEDGRFYADRYVTGVCPLCGYEKARGDECTSCGASYEAEDLKNPRTKIGGKPLIKKITTHWYLRLDLFKEKLLAWLETKDWKPNVINFVKKYIENIKPRAITRDMQWGISVPLPEASGKVFYVWFDAPIGYISATKEWAEHQKDPDRWKDFWLDAGTRLVQFLGKDNIPFHGAVFPSMLMGQDLPYKLVDDMPANEFYTLAGRQFSKSEGWFVELSEFLEKYSADQLRYVIAANAPETQDSEFTWRDFQSRCNADLLGKLGNFVHRTLVFAKNFCGGMVPEKGSLQIEDTEFLAACEALVEQAKEAYSQYRLRRATQILMELACLGNQYFDARKPWQDAKDESTQQRMKNTIACCLDCVKLLALVASPVIPRVSTDMLRQIDLDEALKPLSWDDQVAFEIPSGLMLGTPQHLFKKIEDEEVAQEEAKLNARSALCRKSEEGRPCISIDDFRKIQLEVVEIVEAEKQASSNKLLRLQVSTSLGPRQIVSGIAQFFDPKDLVGKRVVACLNLKSCRIKGTESQGMILTAEHEGGLTLLEMPEVPVGAEIK